MPGDGVAPLLAVVIEAAMTLVLVLTIFGMLSSPSTMPVTPLVLWILIALLVWQGARFTGTSLNPARSLGPAVVSGALAVYWIYVIGPLLGAVVAAGISRLAGSRLRPMTAKIFHDPAYPSVMMTMLPSRREDDAAR